MALEQARRDKNTTYPEFLGNGRCQLVVVAMETGGRWSVEAVQFVRHLARERAKRDPLPLRRANELAYFRRWSRLLACATLRAFAASLVAEPGEWDALESPEAPAPPAADLAAELRFDPLEARGLSSLAPSAAPGGVAM